MDHIIYSQSTGKTSPIPICCKEKWTKFVQIWQKIKSKDKLNYEVCLIFCRVTFTNYHRMQYFLTDLLVDKTKIVLSYWKTFTRCFLINTNPQNLIICSICLPLFTFPKKQKYNYFLTDSWQKVSSFITISTHVETVSTDLQIAFIAEEMSCLHR